MASDGCMSIASGCTLRTVGAGWLPALLIPPTLAPTSVPSDREGRMWKGSACLVGRLLPKAVDAVGAAAAPVAAGPAPLPSS